MASDHLTPIVDSLQSPDPAEGRVAVSVRYENRALGQLCAKRSAEDGLAPGVLLELGAAARRIMPRLHAWPWFRSYSASSTEPSPWTSLVQRLLSGDEWSSTD